MSQQMTKKVGVAMFAALILAGALALFAYSAYQPVKAQTSGPTRTVSPNPVVPNEQVVVTISFGSLIAGGVVETIPMGFEYGGTTADSDASVAADDTRLVTTNAAGDTVVAFALVNGQVIEYMATAPDTEDDYTFSGTYSVLIGGPAAENESFGETTVTVGTGDTNGNGEPSDSRVSITRSSETASDAIRVEFDLVAGDPIPQGGDITVTMKGYQLPGTITEESVLITGTVGPNGEDVFYSGAPIEVQVNTGTGVITLSLASRYSNGSPAGQIYGGSEYEVIFKKTAGIVNPVKSGDVTVTVTDHKGLATPFKTYTDSKVKVAPARGPRGTSVTVTAVGLHEAPDDSDATVYLMNAEVAAGPDGPDGFELGRGTVSGGKISVTVDTSSLKFIPGAVSNTKGTAFQGHNIIRVVDGTGKQTDVNARFEITPLIELGSDTAKRGGSLELTISDWAYGNITAITIGDKPVTHEPDGSLQRPWPGASGFETVNDQEAEFEIIVPNDARLGGQELTILGSVSSDQEGKPGDGKTDKAETTIIIDAFDLTVDPSTAVIGQVIRVEGSGFSSDSSACIVSITVGDSPITKSTSNNGLGTADDPATTDDDEEDCGGDVVNADSNGNLADTFRMPLGLKAGLQRLTIKDSENRVGIADILVPDPTITVTPASSQRGSTVTVIGSNFPAEDLVTVTYAGDTVTATTTDTVGNWRGTFSVPVDAAIGEEHEVVAQSEKKADGEVENNIKKPLLRAKFVHQVPDEIIEVSPGVVAPGTRLNVKASNLPLYTAIGLRIGGIGVAGSSIGELAETDGTGSWEGTPLVPQLTPGTHTVELTVNTVGDDVDVATFVEIADIITRSSDEAFSDLIDNGTLTRVWHLDAATQTWSFFDPAPEFADFNTLTDVSTGQIVTIIMGTQDQFQGRTLYVGSNNVAIE